MSKHDTLYETAMDAVSKLFSDTSVSKETTKLSLDTLVEEIEIRIESLDVA